jgi:hypothetical protein
VAECSISGWQVTARDCTTSTCNFLPTPNAPDGSKGWSDDCAGRGDGESCTAACDGVNSYFGQGYTAVFQAGQWTVQPGGECRGKHASLANITCYDLVQLRLHNIQTMTDLQIS